MPIIVRHDGSPLMAGLDAAAGAAGNALGGQIQGMGGLNDMLMRLAQAQLADQASQRQFDRNVQMAGIEDKMIRGRGQEAFDRGRKAETEDRNQLRDQEMQDAAALAMAYGNHYGVFPPVGLTTRRDVEHWAAGIQADKEWEQKIGEVDRQQGIRKAEAEAERGRERAAVERVAPGVVPDFFVRGQTPQTFEELNALYRSGKDQQEQTDTDRRLTFAATKQQESEDRLRYAANIQALSKQAEIIQGLIVSSQRELAGMNDPQFGGIAKGMEAQAKEVSARIKELQDHSLAISRMIAAAGMTPGRAAAGAGAGAAAGAPQNVDAIIADLMAKGLTDEQIAAELQRRGLH